MVATTRSYNDVRSLARTGQGFDGVVRLSVPGFFGTGVLLGDGLHVLTAAHVLNGHVASDIDVHFETAAGSFVVRASKVSLDPAFDAVNDNADLAIVTLSAPAPVAAERYFLYRDSDELGQVGTLVGYGQPGTGAQGLSSLDEEVHIRRLGMNRLDATVDQLASGGAGQQGLAWRPAAGAQLAADFDNGLNANDAFGRFLDRADLGTGADEAIISPGDSGGPLFVRNKIAGIASYGFRMESSGIIPDIDGSLNSSFGEFAAWQRMSLYAPWIDSTLRADQSGAPKQPSEVKKTVLEGSGGTTLAWFLVTLSQPAQGGEQISFRTLDGTAKANVDYLPVMDTLVFYAGEEHVAIPVEVIGNMRAEGNRTFSLEVSDPVGGHFANGQATLTASRTIIDDDGPVALVGVADPLAGVL